MGQKKIAVLVGASIYNTKGLFNAAHERVKHLREISTDLQIDLFLISTYFSGTSCILLGKKKVERPKLYIKDGLTYRIIWIKNTILDYLLVHKFKRHRYNAIQEFKTYLPLFRDYDLLIGHTVGSYISLINKTFDIPYIITWHGTDIHTAPFLSKEYFNSTKCLLENACHNFFVSKALLKTSQGITQNASKSVSYNGCDTSFVCYSLEKKQRLKNKHAIDNKKIIAFVGNLISVKNIKSLPEIFYCIFKKERNVEFWILGDGPLRKSLKEKTKDLPIRFFGNVEHNQMNDYMNVMDVLILPSLNEGLPLVTIEALRCGCSVVGSRVGGIPEAIGIENTVPLEDPDFSTKIANKALQLIQNKQLTKVNNCFNWNLTAEEEFNIICNILKNNTVK